MKKLFAALVTGGLVLAPTAASARVVKPAPVKAATLVSVVEQCQYGYAWVDVTFKANVAGTYDLWQRGDNAFQTFVDETDTVAAGQTVVTSISLPNPEQVDVFLTKTGQTTALSEKSVPAAECTHPGW